MVKLKVLKGVFLGLMGQNLGYLCLIMGFWSFCPVSFRQFLQVFCKMPSLLVKLSCQIFQNICSYLPISVPVSKLLGQLVMAWSVYLFCSIPFIQSILIILFNSLFYFVENCGHGTWIIYHGVHTWRQALLYWDTVWLSPADYDMISSVYFKYFFFLIQEMMRCEDEGGYQHAVYPTTTKAYTTGRY